jgi:hypothetical protein
MHSEIEKLIGLAIADGQITDKERNVILKKAAELGVDADEVEMLLDGRLHQLEASKPKEKEKVGNIKTCPACGASVKAFQVKCDDCGHEFINTSSNTLQNLIIELNQFKAKNIISDFSEEEKQYCQMIDNFVIPVEKNELLEFITFCYSQTSDVNYMHYNIPSSWMKKGNEALLKAKISFFGTDKYELVKEYEKKFAELSKKKSNRMVYTVIGLFLFLSVLALMIIFGPKN